MSVPVRIDYVAALACVLDMTEDDVRAHLDVKCHTTTCPGDICDGCAMDQRKEETA